jgi:hypothetical protein
MGESVYGPTVRDVLLEASLRLGGEKSFNLGDGSPHLQWRRIAFGEGHYTAIPAYGFANVQVRRILLARADENTPERFVVDAAEVWKSSSK